MAAPRRFVVGLGFGADGSVVERAIHGEKINRKDKAGFALLEKGRARGQQQKQNHQQCQRPILPRQMQDVRDIFVHTIVPFVFFG